MWRSIPVGVCGSVQVRSRGRERRGFLAGRAHILWNMKAIVCERQGNPVTPNISVRHDWPELPAPAAGWVNIRTLASAFNQMDLWVGRGVPGLNLAYPRVSGCDACGVVEAVGAGVDAAWIGRRVIVNAAMRMPERCHPDDPTNSSLAPIFELVG